MPTRKKRMHKYIELGRFKTQKNFPTQDLQNNIVHKKNEEHNYIELVKFETQKTL
jgi:hypothetical protein